MLPHCSWLETTLTAQILLFLSRVLVDSGQADENYLGEQMGHFFPELCKLQVFLVTLHPGG